ncbi:hypothetical protein A5682_10910 [Mycobacterium mantenii]|uniref:DUF5631 domain-containing protein n=1 Tax=Mycobacterium mantenii TaxID=560555 RepID=UPI0007FF58D2|nr:DUF5631 domain-containing protein [Mycobacterium mantenii]OBH69437.1 hypothetical protein A5682_10910 [Mycobacterium mantenii]
MAVFGRMSARQRLRRATRESLATPAFSSPIDCTPWVTGGLWPAELSTVTGETATLAEYLKADLERIAHAANDQLKLLKRAGMTDLSRQAAEARVIDEARGRAVRRVESTIRYLHAVQSGAKAPPAPPPRVEPSKADLEKTQVLPAIREVKPIAEAPAPSASTPSPRPGRRRRRRASALEPVAEIGTPQAPSQEAPADGPTPSSADVSHLDQTQVIPVVRAEPVSSAPEAAPDQADSGRHHAVVGPAAGEDEGAAAEDEHAAAEDEHAAAEDEFAAAEGSPLEETQVIPVVSRAMFEAPTQESTPDQADSGRHHVVVDEPVAGEAAPPVVPQEAVADAAPADATPAAAETDTAAFPAAQTRSEKPSTTTGFENARLNRLLEFVVRQEPRLNWAIGDRSDGTTVLVTDLAHGWIPSGITLPAGVRLLEPEHRSGRVAALIGETVRVVTYAPGDSLHRSVDFAATTSSVEPRALPAIEDLASVLNAAARGRDDLPKIVPRLAQAAAAGTVVVDQEVDVLRVHLDTARYQLLVQYPNINPALLLKCLLMAATEGIASGDAVSANYHLAWYQKLAG